ncbi:DcuS/MalK family sensor histidine kinase [Bacillus sp. 1NLA3E]|uniref:DcuS/MalK family sensor histidine kinase n=1 Tax=Bacillus sp. 1NLA3E TaxID=666686 RepID=UPI000247EA95|nr:DcuS/MalK family sensor histidine kinase [Bacillus sp. 1NLA3E]AGK55802.1 sensory histidine kinase DcuS [Bacillus sp. 1NLA3E]
MVKRLLKLRLRTTITLLVSAVIFICFSVTNHLIKKNVELTTLNNIEEKAKDLSRTVALSPVVIDGLSNNVDEKSIQPYTEKIRKATDVRFIVVLDMNGIRKSHPIKEKIGHKFVGGDDKPVYAGKENLSIGKGTLGMSLRFFTPVYNATGKQIGAVVVGILLDDVQTQLDKSSRVIYISAIIGILVGIFGAVLLAYKVKKIMFGMEPDEIANLLEQRSAMLLNVREGVLAVDRDSKITLLNQEAERLFKKVGINHNPVGQKVGDIIPKFHITSVIETGHKELDQEYSINGLVLVANIVPILVNRQIVGAVATFRDKTEMKIMAEQLTGVRLYAEALRSQTHEFMNKLHVILGMVQLEFYDQLLDYVRGLKDTSESEAGFFTSHFKDPVLSGFLLGKVSYAREKGAELKFADECYLPTPNDQEVIKGMITILGNLIDNAIDAVQNSEEKKVAVEILPKPVGQISITVTDTGTGMSPEMKNSIFEKGFSTKGVDRGYGLYLVMHSVAELNGTIDFCSQEGFGTKINVKIPYENRSDS